MVSQPATAVPLDRDHGRVTVSAEQFLRESARSSLLRFSTAGSVDDGKSTLVGRLLYDTGNIFDDHLDALEQRARREGGGPLSLALLTDGLKAEREQGITIDVAYRYFSTPKRRFILADCPGHEQYTRNMATGCSTADLTILLVDARYGVVTQTKRHSFISALLGTPRIVIAVNKMDLVDYSEKVFENIRQDYTAFASKLGIREVRFIPISALLGDNVVTKSTSMPWYHGETVMEYLETVYIGSDANLVDFRFPVQYIVRPHQDYRGYAGQIASGEIRVGEEVMALPSMRRSTVASIDLYNPDPSKRSLTSATSPLSVCITLTDDIDIARGDMLVRPGNVPHTADSFDAMVVWGSDTEMDPAKAYLIQHTSRRAKAYVDDIKYRVDVNSLSRMSPAPLCANDIARIHVRVSTPLFVDSYRINRATGNFILIDPDTFHTVGAGMILDRAGQHGLDDDAKTPAERNLHLEGSLVSRAQREARANTPARTVWLTGLSGSGKSSIARALERKLFDAGLPVYRLDGDNLRSGLNSDLGFSAADRKENIRRAAEVAKLFNDAGVTVLCSFISPFAEDRARAREIIGSEYFLEVYLETPLEVCEMRDPHGLYKKARSGGLPEFTGITSPYEAPVEAALTLNTATLPLESCVSAIEKRLRTT